MQTLRMKSVKNKNTGLNILEIWPEMKPQGRGAGAWGGLGHKEATCLQSEKNQ